MSAKVIILKPRLSKKVKQTLWRDKYLKHFREKMALDFEQSALKHNRK